MVSEAIRAAGEGPAATLEEAVEQPIDVVCFRVGGAYFGIHAAYVVEIVTAGQITPMPHTPGHLAGVIAFRSDVIAVIDLGRLLDLAVLQPDAAALQAGAGAGERVGDRLVVLTGAGMTVAIRTEVIVGVRTVDAATLHPSTGAARAGNEELFGGHFELGSRLVTMLEMKPLLERARLRRSGARTDAVQ
jgi:chemotaxis signal transduction protein